MSQAVVDAIREEMKRQASENMDWFNDEVYDYTDEGETRKINEVGYDGRLNLDLIVKALAEKGLLKA